MLENSCHPISIPPEIWLSPYFHTFILGHGLSPYFHYVFNVYKKSRGSIEAAYVTRLDLASHWHIFSFKCSSCHGEVEYQKIILVRSSPHELLAEMGWNSWKNWCQNSVKTHHCFYEHGATVAKRKENNAAALHLSHCISWFVNNSIIWGYNDHQNVSKFSPYRVGQFVTKSWTYFFVKLVKWSYIQGLWRLMTLWRG